MLNIYGDIVLDKIHGAMQQYFNTVSSNNKKKQQFSL